MPDSRRRLEEPFAPHVLGTDPIAQLTWPNGLVLRAADAAHLPFRTYLAHNLEPYRAAAGWREALLREVTIDPHRVHFLGKLPYAQYRRVLQVSSAHVYLTYPFVLSWSLLEALASGCAVVASDTAPVREVVHHAENGLLVDFFDGEGLVNAVLRVLMDAGGMKVMRQVAVASVKGRFEEAAGTARYLEWLDVSSKVCMARAEPTSHKVA